MSNIKTAHLRVDGVARDGKRGDSGKRTKGPSL